MKAFDNPWLVINSASGSYDEAVVAGLKDALTAADWAPRRIIDLQQDDLPDRAALEAAGVDLAVVFAGDGTVNALANAIEGWGGTLLVLPGGTANLLSKVLHGDRPVSEIVGDPSRLRPVRRHCARTSQGAALAEILAGPGATWAEVREGMRDGGIGEIARKGVEAIRQSVSGPMVALTEPAVGRGEGYAGIRLIPGEGIMAVEGYGAQDAGDLLRQGVALLKRNFREGPHDKLGQFGEVTCRSLGGEQIDLMIDGEQATGGPEERFLLAELDLDLLASVDG